MKHEFQLISILARLMIAVTFISLIGCGSDGGGDDGNSNSLPITIITGPSDGSIYTKGDIISFTGTASDDEDGNLSGDSLVWSSNIDGEIGKGLSFSIASLSVGRHTISLTSTDSDSGSDTASLNMIVALFHDDFENADCLSKWTVGGRQQEGTNTADCEIRNNSVKGHLFKFSFTEINLTPATGTFNYSEDLSFEFEMEVRASSTGVAPSNYYGLSGVSFSFYDSDENLLGWVGYITATTQYPFNNVAADPTKAYIETTENIATGHLLSVDDILSNIDIDEIQISTVGILFNTYSSTRPIPSVEAELWIDNVIVLGSDE